MKRLEWSRRLRQLIWRPGPREEIEAEVEFHLRMKARDLEATGIPHEVAAHEARRRFGAVAPVVRACAALGRERDVSRKRGDMWDLVRADLRAAVRALIRTPGATVALVATIALAIGATTAIFGVVDAVLLRPLPYPGAERVVTVIQQADDRDRNQTAANYLDLARDGSKVFEAIAGYRGDQLVVIRSGREATRADAAQVTPRFFDVFQMPPLLGRVFGEEAGRGARVAVLGESFWRSRLGADPSIVGESVDIGGEPTIVVGVMPASFRWPQEVGLWIANAKVPPPPFAMTSDITTNRGLGYFDAVARLRPDVSAAAARRTLAAIAAALERIDPEENKGIRYRIESAKESVVGSSRSSMLLLLGGVAMVLLIATANVANLLLARAASRHREFVVRSAIGADRWHLIRQLLVESLLLAGLGGVAGIGLAAAAFPALRRLDMLQIPRLDLVTLDLRVMAFAVVVSIAVGVLFGLSPAFQASRDAAATLRSGGRGGVGRSGQRLRSALVVTQLGLGVVVVSVAGMLAESLVRLEAVDPGFATERVTAISLALTGAKYTAEADQIRFYDRVLAELAARRDRMEASLIFPVPFRGGAGSSLTTSTSPEGSPGRLEVSALVNIASPRALATLSIPIVSGRAFEDADRSSGIRPALINESLAKKLWPGQSALGRILYAGLDRPVTVVGVMADTRLQSADRSPEPAVMLPYADLMLPYLSVLARSDRDGADVVSMVREAVKVVDPAVPLGDVRTMETIVSSAVATPRFRTALLSGFALLALILAAVGVYGLLSYVVTAQRRELAIELAIGASPASVVRRTAWRGIRLAVAGVLVGMVGALAAGRLMGGLLYGVSGSDPAVPIVAAVVLTVIATVACVLPARRAARIDPLEVLRQE